MHQPDVLLYLLMLVVAFLYAAVGHGGASGYLALLALYGFAPATMKTTALMLNLCVSVVAFIQYYRGGHFRWKLFLPVAAASVPMAFIGGQIHLDDLLYKRLLGVLLLIAVLRFLLPGNSHAEKLRPANAVLLVLIGGVIGLVSGMTGIGGGVLLSPVLLLLCWAGQKEAAAVSSLFIFVNSAAGLAGHAAHRGFSLQPQLLGWVLVAFTGGLLGAYLGARRFNHQVLKYILSAVLALAAVKLVAGG